MARRRQLADTISNPFLTRSPEIFSQIEIVHNVFCTFHSHDDNDDDDDDDDEGDNDIRAERVPAESLCCN